MEKNFKNQNLSKCLRILAICMFVFMLADIPGQFMFVSPQQTDYGATVLKTGFTVVPERIIVSLMSVISVTLLFVFVIWEDKREKASFLVPLAFGFRLMLAMLAVISTVRAYVDTRAFYEAQNELRVWSPTFMLGKAIISSALLLFAVLTVIEACSGFRKKIFTVIYSVSSFAYSFVTFVIIMIKKVSGEPQYPPETFIADTVSLVLGTLIISVTLILAIKGIPPVIKAKAAMPKKNATAENEIAPKAE